MLEPYEAQVSSTVLRGRGGSNTSLLPGRSVSGISQRWRVYARPDPAGAADDGEIVASSEWRTTKYQIRCQEPTLRTMMRESPFRFLTLFSAWRPCPGRFSSEVRCKWTIRTPVEISEESHFFGDRLCGSEGTHVCEIHLVSERRRADHGHFDASVREVEFRPYLGEERGKQREKGLTVSAAGYRGVRFGHHENLRIMEPGVVGTLEVVADAEEVIVRRVTRGWAVVDGHREARIASQDPVAVDVPPERVARLEVGHTAAVVVGAGGDADTRQEHRA